MEQLQGFRAAQYGGPHPAAAAAQGGPAGHAAGGEAIVPDSDRVVLHFDVDCFYCQVEESRNPALRGRPVGAPGAGAAGATWRPPGCALPSCAPRLQTAGVTQKYLLVTCNYAARQVGSPSFFRG